MADKADYDEPPKTGNVLAFDLIPCVGLCCCIISFYTEFPACLGAVCEGSVCCIKSKTMVCKVSQEEGTFCKLVSADCDCFRCYDIIALREQLCCLDVRISIPTSDQVPCLFTLLFFTCIYRFKPTCQFAKKIREINTAVTPEIAPEKEWTQEIDPRSKRIYFVNNYTGESQWEVPENYAP